MNHLKSASRESYTVAYRMGGTDNAKWRCTTAMSYENAEIKAHEIRMAGRKALVKKVGEVLDHGLPVGYEYAIGAWNK